MSLVVQLVSDLLRVHRVTETPEKHQACRIGQCVNNLVLRWQHEKAHVYARHISENMELLAQFDEAERAGDVDKLVFCVRSLIVQAASSRAVGMSAQAWCVFKRERSRKDSLNPVWFDWECWEKRKNSLRL